MIIAGLRFNTLPLVTQFVRKCAISRQFFFWKCDQFHEKFTDRVRKIHGNFTGPISIMLHNR